MKITIVGAGGVGGYFGACLAKAGNDVTFIARGANLEAMQNNGLQVKSINDDFNVSNFKVTNNIADSGIADLVIIAVKAWQVKDVAKELALVINDNTMILPLQNGVLATDELKEVLPAANVLSGLCRIISKIESPGVINHFGVDPIIVFGECNSVKTERVQTLNCVFTEAGIKSKIAADIQAELWKKFISICISGLLALTRSTYGEVLEQPETRQMCYQLFNEIADLARKLEVNIEQDFVDKTMSFIDTIPYNSTTSLSRDIWEEKPSELEYQNGAVVKLATKAKLEVPVNSFIYYSLLIMEKRARNYENK